ncbi:hypothetical protein OAM37_00970 [bacterium]|nr:hypothetical protein [bacterium]
MTTDAAYYGRRVAGFREVEADWDGVQYATATASRFRDVSSVWRNSDVVFRASE